MFGGVLTNSPKNGPKCDFKRGGAYLPPPTPSVRKKYPTQSRVNNEDVEDDKEVTDNLGRSWKNKVTNNLSFVEVDLYDSIEMNAHFFCMYLYPSTSRADLHDSQAHASNDVQSSSFPEHGTTQQYP